MHSEQITIIEGRLSQLHIYIDLHGYGVCSLHITTIFKYAVVKYDIYIKLDFWLL